MLAFTSDVSHWRNKQELVGVSVRTIVINVGDLLSRWSNDVLRSTLHRVVAPPAQAISETEAMTPARQSIAFFSNPNFDAEIECLPNCGATVSCDCIGCVYVD